MGSWVETRLVPLRSLAIQRANFMTVAAACLPRFRRKYFRNPALLGRRRKWGCRYGTPKASGETIGTWYYALHHNKPRY
jgi:hypothetical protein